MLLSWEWAVAPASTVCWSGSWPCKGSPCPPSEPCAVSLDTLCCRLSRCTAVRAALVFLGTPLSLSILWKCVSCTCTTSTKADEAKVNWIKLLVVVVQGRQECQFSACVHVLLGRCKSRSYHFWLIALLVSCRKHNPVFHLTVRMEIARVREKNTIILMFSLGGKSNCVNALIYAEFCV